MSNSDRYILGINSAYHESSACLIDNGQLVIAIEEERLNRVKHAKPAKVDNPHVLPLKSIQLCLEKAGISFQDIDLIGYSFNPEMRLSKNKDLQEPCIDGDWGSESGEELFYRKLQEVTQILSNFAGVDVSRKFKWLDHHLCHAASAYFVSPYEEAAVLVVDGIGEFESTTLYKGKGNKLSKLNSIDYPNSLGFLWEKMSEFLGFSEYDACKVMGLASFGHYSYYYNSFKEFINTKSGNFSIDNDIIKFRINDFSALEELFGPRRIAGQELEERHTDIAASLQKITEEIILDLAVDLHHRTKSNNLCLAGGVSLNCVVNGILQEHSSFENIYIQPAANDAGTAIGAAYILWNQVLGNSKNYIMDNPYLGPEYTAEEIETVLDNNNLKYSYHENIEEVTAKLIAQGYIIGWFQGRSEIGPRALGNRSLLADPRHPYMKDIINMKVKKREGFRPFAPSVLAEKADEWFKIPNKQLSSNFMLIAYDVLKNKQKTIPAVTHVDGTSRIQTVQSSSNPKYHKLIKEFEKITEVPILLNTSLNKLEPIVCSPQDAVNTMKKANLYYLAIGNFLVDNTWSK
ncbi:putative carbamoyl transferase, NodU family [Xenococcus sp. PCC 7305]|uniref:carbamoyltransferase family protein n=1 Tax=Xenococcus sp. PCC 7305 TaxID=102125 RepID=UPI0002AC2049|nr:carbamoyltransferase C-terminal domain-containing protein [Xenococcus sp. PCC 7305]ELS02563.1 putative carbamoyl transferase, NodU family [Xenococcus sp. PCC 7305]